MGTPLYSCYTVYRYPHISSNQLFRPLHSCFCHNLNMATSSGIICEFRTSLREFLDQVVNRFTRQTLPTVNMKHLFMNILCIESFWKKNAQKNSTLRQYTPQARPPFWLQKPVSEFAHACLLPRLPWNWTVLPHSDTHRKPITAITAVLLPFVAYLLILPRTLLKNTQL
jgi:hypothetical protein